MFVVSVRRQGDTLVQNRFVWLLLFYSFELVKYKEDIFYWNLCFHFFSDNGPTFFPTVCFYHMRDYVFKSCQEEDGSTHIQLDVFLFGFKLVCLLYMLKNFGKYNRAHSVVSFIIRIWLYKRR